MPDLRRARTAELDQGPQRLWVREPKLHLDLLTDRSEGAPSELAVSSQELHRGGDPADLARGLYRPAFVVGVLGLAVAVYAAGPFFVLTA